MYHSVFPQVADFGLAVNIDATATHVSAFQGTLSHMVRTRAARPGRRPRPRARRRGQRWLPSACGGRGLRPRCAQECLQGACGCGLAPRHAGLLQPQPTGKQHAPAPSSSANPPSGPRGAAWSHQHAGRCAPTAPRRAPRRPASARPASSPPPRPSRHVPTRPDALASCPSRRACRPPPPLLSLPAPAADVYSFGITLWEM